MKFSRKQKDKILDWLCKKSGIKRFYFDQYGFLRFDYERENYTICQNVLIEKNEEKNYCCKHGPKIKKKFKNEHILDLLLRYSIIGYEVSNGLYGSYRVDILKPFTSIYELMINIDLES